MRGPEPTVYFMDEISGDWKPLGGLSGPVSMVQDEPYTFDQLLRPSTIETTMHNVPVGALAIMFGMSKVKMSSFIQGKRKPIIHKGGKP